MANEVENQERVPDNLRSLIAVAVRSVQWSYAIFWSQSNRGQGVLEWTDGYYNGEINTTRNVRATELTADKMGLKRSEQLRELYEFLLEMENDQQKPGASATLSPQDLTDAEWYYLVCMSFVFNEGEGLPGRAFANDEPIWLSGAHLADSEVFCRCLLAKSASIQTVICFPHLGGVIELGVTEMVSEDHSLIQHIKTSFLNISKPFCTKKSSAPHRREGEPEFIYVNDNHEIANTMEMEASYSLAADTQFHQDGLKMGSSEDSSNEYCEHNHQRNDSFSNRVEESMDFSNFKDMGLSSWDLLGISDDLHYIRTVSAILRSSGWRLGNPSLLRRDSNSSFSSWKKGKNPKGHRLQVHQKTSKKILFRFPSMHSFCRHKNSRKDLLFEKPESNKIGVQHEDKMMEKDKFLVLKSMVPSFNVTDEASVLGNTIRHLIELESMVNELESCIDLPELEASTKHPDFGHQTSKNYLLSKRKASVIDENEPEISSFVVEEEPNLSLQVKAKGQEVLVEMKCPWRDYLLHDIMDAMNIINLDAHSVQTSTVDGILALSVQSKLRGTTLVSPRMVKQILLSAVVGPC